MPHVAAARVLHRRRASERWSTGTDERDRHATLRRARRRSTLPVMQTYGRRRSRSCAARAPSCGTARASEYLDFLVGPRGHRRSATPTPRSPTRSPSRRARCCTCRTCYNDRAAGRGGRARSTALLGGGGQVFFATPAPRPTSARSSWPASTAARRPTTSSSARTARSTAARSPRSPPPASRRSRRRSSRCPRASARSRATTSTRSRPRSTRSRRRGAARAGAGRGRREPGDDRVLRRASARCATSAGCCFMVDEVQTGLGRTGAVVRLPALRRRARRRHDGQGARQRRADRRVLGHGATWPPRSSPATTPRPSAASRCATAAGPAPCSTYGGRGRARPGRAGRARLTKVLEALDGVAEVAALKERRGSVWLEVEFSGACAAAGAGPSTRAARRRPVEAGSN